nr:MAG TPA: hypothetical protein [Caudoviricetes sp.]
MAQDSFLKSPVSRHISVHFLTLLHNAMTTPWISRFTWLFDTAHAVKPRYFSWI